MASLKAKWQLGATLKSASFPTSTFAPFQQELVAPTPAKAGRTGSRASTTFATPTSRTPPGSTAATLKFRKRRKPSWSLPGTAKELERRTSLDGCEHS